MEPEEKEKSITRSQATGYERGYSVPVLSRQAAENAPARDSRKLFKEGLDLINQGYSKEAVKSLEKALELGEKNSACLSFLGLAIARSGGSLLRAEELCLNAVTVEFYWPQFYVNLAAVYFIWGKKSKAVRVLKKGLKVDHDNEAILKELQKIGMRKAPLLPCVSRANPINKYLGIIFKRPKAASKA